jgi:hypothetical protein
MTRRFVTTALALTAVTLAFVASPAAAFAEMINGL